MGCFQSSEAEPARKQAAAAPKRAAATAANAAPVAAVPVPAAPRQKIVITEVDKVKLKLKNQRDVLEQGVRKSEAVVAHDMKMARELLAGGQRESAKVLIRRKRVLEAQVASTVAKLDAVENSLSTIEGTEMTEAVLEAVERGNKAVETLNARVTVERVENAMAADADAQAYVDEVSTALGLFDEKEACEEEVLADLAEFEKEHGIASATNTDTGVNGAVNGTKQTAVEEDADVITPVKQQVVEEEDVVTPVVEEEEDEDAIRPVVPKKRTAVPA